MSKSILNAQAVAALVMGLAAPQAFAADSGQLYYPPGPPAIDSAVYAPASMVTGDVAVGGSLWGGDGDSAFEVLGAGRVDFPLHGGSPWHMTAEVFGAAAFFDPTETTFLGAIHGYHKTEQYAHGLYAAASGFGAGDFSVNTFGVGVEGAAFMGNTALVGRVGHYWFGGDAVGSSWWAEGIGRYYVTPNTKLAGILSWQNNPNVFMLAAGVEHLFSGSNISGLGRTAWFTGDGYSAWELMIGAKLMFGRPGTTLQQHDWDIPFAEASAINF